MIIAYLYQITNLLNGKCYLGVTKNPQSRMKQHLFKGTGSLLVKDAVSKYGVDNFEFKIIVVGEQGYIYDLEKTLIESWATQTPTGYNIAKGGLAPFSPLGKKRSFKRVLSEETKKKISKSMQGKKKAPHTKKPMSKETKDKISQANKGKVRSEVTKDKMSKSRTGVTWSANHRKARQMNKETA